MKAQFRLTTQAAEDLDVIWWTIAEGSREAAERVEAEILATCPTPRQASQGGIQAEGHHPAPS